MASCVRLGYSEEQFDAAVLAVGPHQLTHLLRDGKREAERDPWALLRWCRSRPSPTSLSLPRTCSTRQPLALRAPDA